MTPMRLLTGEEAVAPALALSMGIELLRRVQRGQEGPLLRVYRPRPTVAFGARDRLLPGFQAAAEAARAHGFTPVLRGPGGRAAAYHEGSLVIDHIEPDDSFLADTRGRFERFGEQYVRALRGLGVDARLGPVPGEYCPGEHSVNAAGRVKIIGTAQRVVKGGFLFSSSIVVTDPAPIRAVLTDVYAALDLDWDPATGGSITETAPGVTVDAVAAAVIGEYARRWTLSRGAVDAEVIDAARAHLARHEIPPHRPRGRQPVQPAAPGEPRR
ncbi:lipoate--protein ligase family protein [Sediminivirga luteola]